MRMHRDLGMRVRPEKLRPFDADGPITKSGAFGGAGNDTYVIEHIAPSVPYGEAIVLCAGAGADPSMRSILSEPESCAKASWQRPIVRSLPVGGTRSENLLR